mgnify:CR=1 FL=1
MRLPQLYVCVYHLYSEETTGATNSAFGETWPKLKQRSTYQINTHGIYKRNVFIYTYILVFPVS